VDKGDDPLTEAGIREESNQLIKYFLTALTVPENEVLS
jgi:hypothetical protein